MENNKEQLLIYCNRQICDKMHICGPGFRTTYIIHYVIRGSGYFAYEGKTHKITEGQSFVIRPFTKIQYYPDKNNPWEYTWIEFNGNKLLHKFGKIAYCEGACVIDYIAPKLILPLYDSLRSICDPASGIRFSDAARDVALAILSVYSSLKPLHSPKPQDSVYFDSACTIIQSSYHNPELGIESLCSKLNISRATLHRSFISNCGISPGAYLLNYRTEMGKELLRHGISVKSAALSCGFSDPLYFSKVFHKKYGMSPREFCKTKNNFNI